jgi:hypothetical protein
VDRAAAGAGAVGSIKGAIIGRRGREARNIAKVDAARQLLTLVFYGLRDGQIRGNRRRQSGTPARSHNPRKPRVDTAPLLQG